MSTNKRNTTERFLNGTKNTGIVLGLYQISSIHPLFQFKTLLAITVKKRFRKLVVSLDHDLVSHGTRCRRLNDKDFGFDIAACYHFTPFCPETVGNLSHGIMIVTKSTNAIRKVFGNKQVTAKLCPNDVQGFEL